LALHTELPEWAASLSAWPPFICTAIDERELRKLVKYTLADLQKTKSRDLFTPDLINTIIGNKAGQNFLSMKLKEFYANSGATASSLSPSAGRYGSSATASRLAPSKSEIRNQRLLF
jgi:hypothetical protein